MLDEHVGLYRRYALKKPVPMDVRMHLRAKVRQPCQNAYENKRQASCHLNIPEYEPEQM